MDILCKKFIGPIFVVFKGFWSRHSQNINRQELRKYNLLKKYFSIKYIN